MKVTVIAELNNGTKIVMDDRYATVQAIDGVASMPIDVFSREVFTERCRRKHEAALAAKGTPDATH